MLQSGSRLYRFVTYHIFVVYHILILINPEYNIFNDDARLFELAGWE